MALIVLPDPIAPTLRYLAGVDEVTAIFGARIGTRLDPETLWPAARLDPSGGLPVIEERIDQPRIQVHSFAVDDQTALDGARILRAALAAMAGYREPDVICVIDVQTTTVRLLDDSSAFGSSERVPPVSHATFAAIVAVRPDP